MVAEELIDVYAKLCHQKDEIIDGYKELCDAINWYKGLCDEQTEYLN